MRLLLFGLFATASVAIGFLAFDVNHARRVVERYGYYTIATTFAWALFAWWKLIKQKTALAPAVDRKDAWQAAGVIAACTIVAAMTVPFNYKVLYDEMVIQATAWNLHFFREVSTIVRGYTVDGVFMPMDMYLDKRPFFFAFLVSLLHDLTGYREFNAFALNFSLLPVVLGQVYRLGRRFAGHLAVLSAVAALGMLSVLAHSATGAGMEMLNLSMLLLVVQLACSYLDDPTDARLTGLVLAAVLLAQTRYESSLFVVSVACVALEGWRRRGRVILPVAAIVAPLLLIPYAVHNTYLSGTPLLWELRDNVQTRFGIEHLGANLAHARAFFFGGTRLATNSWWLSVTGFAALGFAAWRLWRRRRDWRTAPAASVVWLCFGAVISANLSLLMFYYWGQLDDPIVARLSLPFYTLLAVAVAFAVDRLSTSRWRLAHIMVTGAGIAYLWNGLTANAQHIALNTLGTEIAWENRYVDALNPGERLIITGKSALPWMLRRTSAIAINHARRRADALRYHLAQHTFKEVLVFQHYLPSSAEGDYQLDPADRLPDSFVLEPITERRFGTRLDRVSRVVQIRSLGEPSAIKP